MQYHIVRLSFIFVLLIAGISLSGQDIAELEKDFRKDLKRAKQYPRNENRLAELAASYQAVTRFDRDAISRLRATGQPDIWYNIYRIQVNMDKRQSQVMTLPEHALRTMNITVEDYSKEIQENKNKAAAYFHAHAIKLLEQEEPEAARQAYQELVLLARLTDQYGDIDRLIRKAVLFGATKIEYELYNRTGRTLNERIVDQLSVAVYAYRDQRLKAVGSVPADESFPFLIQVYLTEVKVSPDRTKELSYVEERDIYREGEVVDTIRCHIDQYKQVKGAVLSGRIDIYDVNMKSVINTVPINAESMFLHSYATLKGNPDAAGEETRKMLSQKKVEFPSNEKIVMDAAEEFTKLAIKVLLP
jgi:tetratricopeptide (TPR) repeat protein